MSKAHYNKRVKVTDWWMHYQIYPIDRDPNDSRSAYYKSFGPNNDVFIPKTTSQEVTQIQKIYDQPGKMQDSAIYSTYPLKTTWMRKIQFNDSIERETLSSYQASYFAYFDDKTKIDSYDRECRCHDNEDKLDPLMNRRPKTDFALDPTSENKFMDDHWLTPSKGRKHNNFLRQLRNKNAIKFGNE